MSEQRPGAVILEQAGVREADHHAPRSGGAPGRERPGGGWREPRGQNGAMTVYAGVVVESPNGGWAISDERGAVPDAALLLDAAGAPSVDDALRVGVQIRRGPNRLSAHT